MSSPLVSLLGHPEEEVAVRIESPKHGWIPSLQGSGELSLPSHSLLVKNALVAAEQQGGGGAAGRQSNALKNPASRTV